MIAIFSPKLSVLSFYFLQHIRHSYFNIKFWKLDLTFFWLCYCWLLLLLILGHIVSSPYVARCFFFIECQILYMKKNVQISWKLACYYFYSERIYFCFRKEAKWLAIPDCLHPGRNWEDSNLVSTVKVGLLLVQFYSGFQAYLIIGSSDSIFVLLS